MSAGREENGEPSQPGPTFDDETQADKEDDLGLGVDLEEDDAVTEERQNRMDQRTDLFCLVLH